MVEITFFKNSQRTFKLFNIWPNRYADNKSLFVRFRKFAVILCTGVSLIIITFTDAVEEIKHGTMEVTFTKVLYFFAIIVCTYKMTSAALLVDEIYECINEIEHLSKQFKDTSDIEKCLGLYNKLFIVGEVAITTCSILFLTAPITTDTYRPLPFTPNLPFLEVDSTPNWQLIYLFEIIGVVTITILTIAYDTLFCGMMLLCSGILSSICREIREFENFIDNHQASDAKMKNIIDKIIATTKLLKNISDVNSTTSMLHMIYNCNTLALALYMVSILPFGNMASLCMMTLVFLVIFQLWIYCFFGQDVVNQVEILRGDLYFIRWYDASKNFKTMLALTILEAQNDSYIYAGKVVPLSLETLTEVIKKAYAFYTFLNESR